MNYQSVIFDWDGTLVDSVEHIADSLHRAAIDTGLPPRERQAYRNIIGLGIIEALESLYPGIDPEQARQLRERDSLHFSTRQTTPSELFPGVSELLTELRLQGRGRAVATGKSRHGLARALASSGTEVHFDITRCADESRSKPDPAMLADILRFYGIEPDRAVMIGDTAFDMEMAARIGMPAIGVTWGAHDKALLAEHNPITIAHSIDELREALLL